MLEPHPRPRVVGILGERGTQVRDPLVTIALRQVTYVRRFLREARVGFAA